jgi:Flp pilus assembly protein TadG
MRATTRALSDFANDRSGNFTLMAAVSMSVLLLAMGFGINVAQSLNVKSSLQSALDAAVTSTARDLTTGTIEEKDARTTVEAFLKANSTSRFSTNDHFVLDNLVINKTARTITATAHANVVLAFPLFNIGAPRVGTESAAVYSDINVEVAMILDLTGSMAGQKIEDLKTAALSAVEIFLGNQNSSKPRKRVAMVPYANSVDVGSLAATSVFVESASTDRTKTGGNTDPKQVSGGSQRPDNCATERPGKYQYTDDGPEISMVHRDFYMDGYIKQNTSFWGPKPIACPKAPVIPLTADAAKLNASIAKFEANGGTAGHIGIQWGWYMLSEKWGSVMGEAARPAKLEKNKVAKYAILMTDGEFNLSYFDINKASDAYNGKGKKATRDAAVELCKAMRLSGIEIFSIGFGLGSAETNAKQTLRDCANPDTGAIKYYYETSTGAQLKSAFEEIAGNIEGLVLTK